MIAIMGTASPKNGFDWAWPCACANKKTLAGVKIPTIIIAPFPPQCRPPKPAG
jgi:hypothetical protein